MGGDSEARRVDCICKRAGVRVLKYPMTIDQMEIGDTTAIRTIYSAVKRFGEDLVEVALSCARAGGAGWLSPVFIRGFCLALESEGQWAASRKLLKIVQSMPFTAIYRQAGELASSSDDGRSGAAGGLIAEFLDKQFARKAV